MDANALAGSAAMSFAAYIAPERFEFEATFAEFETPGPRVLTYTAKDVIDNRISIPAQHALVRLSKNPQFSSDAVELLQEIKAGRLAGIFCSNWEKPAKRAL